MFHSAYDCLSGNNFQFTPNWVVLLAAKLVRYKLYHVPLPCTFNSGHRAEEEACGHEEGYRT